MVDRFKIIVFTPEKDLPDEAGRLSDLLRAGVDCIHIRKPGASADKVRNLLRDIDAVYHDRLRLHDCPELIDEFPAVGFHLNSRYSDVRARSLSRSCHSAGEVLAAGGLEYVTLSPVFDSISKPGYRASADAGMLPADRKVDVIALGGVTLDRIPSLVRRGFDGAALLGAVWNEPDGFKKTLAWLRNRNMSLQFITDGSDPLPSALAALEGGCRWIQVRMKDASDTEVEQVVRRLSPACRRYGATLLVDDRVGLACRMRHMVDGVHLGQLDMDPRDARRMLGDDKIIGLTVNCPAHLEGDGVGSADYYGIGPWRFTTTKKNLARPLGIEGYKEIMRHMTELRRQKPFVAIGGITPDDIAVLASAGVRAFAVSGAISKAGDPRLATGKFISEIQKHITI